MNGWDLRSSLCPRPGCRPPGHEGSCVRRGGSPDGPGSRTIARSRIFCGYRSCPRSGRPADARGLPYRSGSGTWRSSVSGGSASDIDHLITRAPRTPTAKDPPVATTAKTDCGLAQCDVCRYVGWTRDVARSMLAHTFLVVTTAWTAAIWDTEVIPPRSAHRGGSPPTAGQLLLHTTPPVASPSPGTDTASAMKGRSGQTTPDAPSAHHASCDASDLDSTQPAGHQASDRPCRLREPFDEPGP
jgi:hypothetical protein